MDTAAFLRNVPVLADLPDDLLRRIAEQLSELRVQAGDWILREELAVPFWTAVAEVELSEWLTRRGKPDEAMSAVEDARETFARLGATPWLQRAETVITSSEVV